MRWSHTPLSMGILALAIAQAVAPSARAETHAPIPPTVLPAPACAEAISNAERAQGLPPGLLQAIARVESGRADTHGVIAAWPWTLNVEGQGSFFDSKQAALESLTTLRARGVKSIDVGCLQVNLLHHPEAFATLDEALDPAHNAAYAAHFLNDLHNQLGSWPAATAAYHSATPELGIPYQMKVEAAWHGGGNGIRWWPSANGPIQIVGHAAPTTLAAASRLGPQLRSTTSAPVGRSLDAYRITPIRAATPIRIADRR